MLKWKFVYKVIFSEVFTQPKLPLFLKISSIINLAIYKCVAEICLNLRQQLSMVLSHTSLTVSSRASKSNTFSDWKTHSCTNVILRYNLRPE